MLQNHQSVKQRLGRGCVMLSLPLTMLYTLGATSSVAQAGEGAVTLEEIMVTAQRRSQSLQDVPLAISAVTGDNLKELGITELYGLSSLAPNLDISHTQGEVKIFIRGIGKALEVLGSEGSVALHQDGIVIPYPGAQSTAFFDIERIEVVRGPQGTLYGRNATGGALNIITRGPSEELQLDVRLNVGNYNMREVEIGVGGTLIEGKLFGRIAIYNVDRDGFGINIADGSEIDDRNETAVRARLKWLATERLTVELELDHWAAKDANGVVHTFGAAFGELRGVTDGGIPDPNFRDISSDFESVRDKETFGVALTTTYEINDEWTLKSLTGYRDMRSLLKSQYDGTDAPGWSSTRTATGRNYSQELQLNWDTDSQNSVFGVYYFNEEGFTGNVVPFEFVGNGPGDIFWERGNADKEAWAVFGSSTWAVTDRLNVTGGLRYSKEKRHSDGIFSIQITPFVSANIPSEHDRTYTAWTPRFSVDYAITDDTMIYATVSKGFKSGQILAGNTSPPLEPEFLWSYEGGLKTVQLDGRLKANLTAFYYDYTDLQVAKLDGLQSTIENAASAKMIGFEAEITYLIGDNTQFNLVYGYLDAEFKEYLTDDPIFPELGTLDLSGNPLPSAAKHMFTASLSHTVPTKAGDFRFLVNWRWKDKAYFDPYMRESASQDAYSDVSARVNFKPEGQNWSISAWANNLFDKEAIRFNYVSLASGGFPRNGAVNDPRTFGAEFNYNF